MDTYSMLATAFLKDHVFKQILENFFLIFWFPAFIICWVYYFVAHNPFCSTCDLSENQGEAGI